MFQRCNTYLIGFIFFILCINNVVAQNSSFEVWPETDIWYRLSPSLRLSSYLALTKYHESGNRDLNIYLQGDHAWGHTKYKFVKRLKDESRAETLKAWMVRGGYMKGWSIGENENEYSEDLILAEIHKRIPIKGSILISQRLRTDFRWLGHNDNFSYRFRYRLMVEKEYTSGKTSIVPYLNAEPYWDSRYSIFNRIRLIGGATITWKELFAVEGNLTYQYDVKSSIPNVYALNIILHLFFEKAKKSQG